MRLDLQGHPANTSSTIVLVPQTSPPGRPSYCLYKRKAGWPCCRCGRMNLQLYEHLSCRQNSIAAKWNIFLCFGLKVPFSFPCWHASVFQTVLALFFSQRLTSLWLSRFFWRPCTFGCVPVRFYSIGLCPSVAARSLFEVGGLACFYEWMDSVSDFATYA